MKYDLLQHVGTKQKVMIDRPFQHEPNLNGYLLDSSSSLVLMHQFHDFMPDGYTIFRLEDVTDFRSGPYERFWDEMIQGERLTHGLDRVFQLDLSSMRSAIESIAEEHKFMIIECEDEDANNDEFYIGSLVSASFESITFRHFDALGYWEDEPYEIELDDITKIQFDTPYANTFSKYLKTGSRPMDLEVED